MHNMNVCVFRNDISVSHADHILVTRRYGQHSICNNFSTAAVYCITFGIVLNFTVKSVGHLS